MNLKNLFFLLLILRCIPGYSYSRDTVKLFYDINQKELAPVNKAKLDSLNKFLDDTSTVRVFGFADYLGKSESNLSLSKDRADIVKDYLSALHRTNVRIVADGMGEVSSVKKTITPLGEPLNRRVEVIFMGPAEKAAIHKQQAEKVYSSINNLSNLKVGESESFSELTFQANRHFLNEDAIPYLQALGKYLKSHDNLKIEIQGHICCQFDQGDGFDVDVKQNNLSEMRAKFIYDYLLGRGIKADRMKYKGLGSSKPKIFPEVTVEDQNKNRRVEIVLLSK